MKLGQTTDRRYCLRMRLSGFKPKLMLITALAVCLRSEDSPAGAARKRNQYAALQRLRRPSMENETPVRNHRRFFLAGRRFSGPNSQRNILRSMGGWCSGQKA